MYEIKVSKDNGEAITTKIRNLYHNFQMWYGGLQEVWQRGYSWEYREYRFREAFGLLSKE